MNPKKCWVLVFLLLLDLSGLAGEVDISQLKDDIATSKVWSLKVIYVPYDTESIITISPDDLMRDSKASVTKVRCKNEIRASLIKTIEETKANSSDELGDIRWGLIFYDKDKKEIHSIYIDRRYINSKTNRAYIDGKMVEINDALIGWLELHFMPKKHRAFFLFNFLN